MAFPRLRYIEIEGRWSFLPFVLTNELTSLKALIVRHYNDRPCSSVEDIDELLWGFLGGATSRDGSLPLFLGMALEMYPEYRRK